MPRGCPHQDMEELSSDKFFGSGGPYGWHAGGITLSVSSGLITFSRTWDGECSGTSESLAKLGCFLGCL